LEEVAQAVGTSLVAGDQLQWGLAMGHLAASDQVVAQHS